MQRPASSLLAGFATVLVITTGCSKHSKSAAAALLGGDDDPAYVPVPGEDASLHLASAHDVTPLDPVALGKALDLANANAAKTGGASLLDGSGDVGQTDSATVALLKSAAQAKASLASSTFTNPALTAFNVAALAQSASLMLTVDPSTVPTVADPGSYDFKSDKVDLDSGTWQNKSSIMISRVGQIPVKNQGQRGTCAAHTGVAALEYMILKKHSSVLTTIDLAEQRFYMMSKTDLWNSGGTPEKDAGSNWYNGYKTSFGYSGTTVPSANPTYNIPLEDDCPYNATPGANELQLPQALSCERGAVRVTSLSETFYYNEGSGKEYHSTGVLTAQDIFNYLVKYDLPVPMSANVTQNFENNDGTITLAKDQNPQSLGGHAFLIVGAKQISEAQFPNEGGMCFIVKNSWGTGWGTGGYACMTLAWFNAFRTTGLFNLAFDVDVDMDYVLSKAQKTIPTAITTAGGSLLDTSSGSESVPVNPVALPSTPNNPDLSQIAAADAGPSATPNAPAAPAPSAPAASAPSGSGSGSTSAAADPVSPASVKPVTTTSDGYTLAALVDQTGYQFKVLYKTSGSMIALVGILRGETSVSKPLNLAYDSGSGNITYTDAVRGDKVVGQLSGSTISLCSGTYADVCLLHVQPSDNSLVLGLSEDEYYRYTPNPNASFTTLIAFDGYGIDVALSLPNYADFRLELGGQPTNALRLKVDAISGAISYGGREVGNYQALELCSGGHSAVCRFVLNTDDKSLNLFLNAKAQ